MALVKCYECEKEISDKAPACSHCGAPAEEQPTQAEEVEILESVAVVDEPEPITQETVSALSTEPEPVATKDERFNPVVAIAVVGMNIERSTFLIDETGNIERIWRNVRPGGGGAYQNAF